LSTRAETVAALLDGLSPAGTLTARAMFGEYALYLQGRVVALICDDRLFVKPTPGAVSALPGTPMASPYPGAKPHLAADAALDDPEPVIRALRAVATELPAPKPKSKPTTRRPAKP
jgi:TfoX/Sxy family transcriptional regulator of competence genes